MANKARDQLLLDLDSISDAVVLCDVESGKILTSNRLFDKNIRHSSEKNIRDLLPKQTLNRSLKNLQKRGRCKIDLQIARGKLRFDYEILINLISINNEPYHLVTYKNNNANHESKAISRALKKIIFNSDSKQEDLIDLNLEIVNDAIAVCDCNTYEVIAANNIFKNNIFDKPPFDLYEIIPQKSHEKARKGLQKRGRFKFEKIIHRGKLTFFYDITIKKEKIKNHEYYVATFKDANYRDEITALAKSITNLNSQKAELEEALKKNYELSKAKDTFLATMSHELRTPLNGILGIASLLNSENMPKEQKDMVSTIQQCGEGLLSILNNILDLSKLLDDKIVLESENFHYLQLINHIIDLHKSTIATSEVTLDHDHSQIPSELHLVGDYNRLTQILNNLISNAIKFTGKGSIKINSTYDSDKSLLEISVTDTGVGVSKESLLKVFDPFAQEDSSTTRKYGGTGLGLPITKKLIETMGGQIMFDSKKNVGTAVSITIPFAEGEATPPVAKEEIFNWNNPPRLRILLAEDNLVNQNIVSKILTKFKQNVDIANDGLEAVELYHRSLAEGQPYDLILMDIRMPEMDGVEATKKIIRESSIKPPPIVALTANTYHLDQKKCLDAGMQEVISKPFKISRLKEILEQNKAWKLTI